MLAHLMFGNLFEAAWRFALLGVALGAAIGWRRLPVWLRAFPSLFAAAACLPPLIVGRSSGRWDAYVVLALFVASVILTALVVRRGWGRGV